MSTFFIGAGEGNRTLVSRLGRLELQSCNLVFSIHTRENKNTDVQIDIKYYKNKLNSSIIMIGLFEIKSNNTNIPFIQNLG
jgi:hypothetical protein